MAEAQLVTLGLTYIFNFWHLGTERRSAQMSEIKNVG